MTYVMLHAKICFYRYFIVAKQINTCTVEGRPGNKVTKQKNIFP